MPLRQDGSGGIRSARPPTSIPPERTSHYIELHGTSTLLGSAGVFDPVCASGRFDALQSDTRLSPCRSVNPLVALGRT